MTTIPAGRHQAQRLEPEDAAIQEKKAHSAAKLKIPLTGGLVSAAACCSASIHPPDACVSLSSVVLPLAPNDEKCHGAFLIWASNSDRPADLRVSGQPLSSSVTVERPGTAHRRPSNSPLGMRLTVLMRPVNCGMNANDPLNPSTIGRGRPSCPILVSTHDAPAVPRPFWQAHGTFVGSIQQRSSADCLYEQIVACEMGADSG